MLAALLAGLLVLGVAPAASAHVHGITPLLELGCKVDNSITGANRVDSTPASAANGGPISGLIPVVVGHADLGFGDGGFGAANDDVCP
jgi:hypothetical protein